MSPDKTNLSPENPPFLNGGKKENFFKEIFKFALLAAIIVLPIRIFIAQPFVVSGASMDPTFESGQYLIVDQISYRFGSPKRGDVIIFRYPLDKKKFFIKRIIGLPSETVDLQNGQISITNKDGAKALVTEESYISSRASNDSRSSVILKNNEYFVLGDNRTESSDSRFWGAVESSLIIGRPFISLFPISKISLLPGVGVPNMQDAGKI
ncbi:MAG: signal peptidase I [Patescibacteria group bacterium]